MHRGGGTVGWECLVRNDLANTTCPFAKLPDWFGGARTSLGLRHLPEVGKSGEGMQVESTRQTPDIPNLRLASATCGLSEWHS
jgi:hypothetical protein